MTKFFILYPILSYAFFLALPPFRYLGQTDWDKLVAQLFMSALWPFFLTVAIFRRIINP